MSDYRADYTGVDPDKPRFELVPEGQYTFQVKKAEAAKSKKGYFMVKCECEIINDIEWMGKKINHYVTFVPKDSDGAGIPVHFLKVIGQPWEGKFDVTVKDWEGGTFLGTVKHEDYEATQGKNAGKIFKSAKIAYVDYLEPLPEMAKDDSKKEEEIPF